MTSCDKMLSVKDSILLKIYNREKYQIYVMDLISHPEITLIMFCRTAIQPVRLFVVNLFVPFHLMA